MNVIVMKFGGTSVANIKKIQNVAGIVKQNLHKDNKLVVVLSAMAGVTNELQKYLDDINSDNDIENDLVLTSGVKKKPKLNFKEKRALKREKRKNKN